MKKETDLPEEKKQAIRPEELRIGNLIMANGLHGGKQMTVDGVSKRGTMNPDKRVILFKEHDVGEFIRDCEGIPLSPEWLERLGFEVEYTNGGFLRWQKGQFKMLDRRLPYPQYHAPEAIVLYVHQLQNLYFALTGQELKLGCLLK